MSRIEARLQTVAIGPRPLADHYDLAPADQIERAAGLAEPLAGARIIYVSTAPPEAADLSGPLVALLRDLGVDAEWAVLHGDGGFQRASRMLGDALRGARWHGGGAEWQRLRESCESAAISADLRSFDAVFAHGPAAAALIEGRRGGSTAWLWRTGLDISQPDEGVWREFGPLLADYSQLSCALPEFVPPGVGGPSLRITPGAFDPLAQAHGEQSPREMARRIRRLGIDPSRPLIVDVTRLDRWADPLAAVEAWHRARAEVEGLQLALIGRLDRGDREAAVVVAEVRAFAGAVPDLHVLADRPGVEERDRGALTRLARCATQTALGDEFDPALSGAHWRGTAVVAGGASAAAQINDGEDGYVASGLSDRADRITRLASDPGRAVAMGRAGREHARARFLVTRLLTDELATIGSLLRREAPERARVGVPV